MTADRPVITIIADYGPADDMAFDEVELSLLAECGDAVPHMIRAPVSAFDTLETGFRLAQLALNSKLGSNHFFYVNTAPRQDNPDVREDCEGEELLYLRLHNGVQIVAVNSGYSLAFVKSAAEEIRTLDIEKAGSQFRSRDVFPEALGALIAGRACLLNGDASSQVPEGWPQDVILYTDGYGNMKCAIDATKLDETEGQTVAMTIGNETMIAKVGRKMFEVPVGGLSLAAGSSGWSLPDGTQVRFAEISQRLGSASALFGHPKSGTPVKWEQAKKPA